jgi:hypothetical protein
MTRRCRTDRRQPSGPPGWWLRAFHVAARCAAWALVGALAGCAGGPPPPDWQLNARSALDQSTAAYLRGDSRVAQQDFERARAEIARTGRADLLARAELMRCAAHVASLEFGPCDGFERLRADAPAAEQAYADYLAGGLPPARADLLTPAQRAVAAAAGDAAAAQALQQIDDPVSRLVAAGVLLQAGRTPPAAIALAVDTASAQGWRRPLLAWLGVQLQRAEQAGDDETAARLRRRIGWIQEPARR